MATPNLLSPREIGRPEPVEAPGVHPEQPPEIKKSAELRPAPTTEQAELDKAAAAEVIRKIAAGEKIGEKGQEVLGQGTQEFFASLKGNTPAEKANDLFVHLNNAQERAFEAQDSIKKLIKQERENQSKAANAELN